MLNIRRILRKDFMIALFLNSFGQLLNMSMAICVYFIYEYMIYNYSASEGCIIGFSTGMVIVLSSIVRKSAILKIKIVKAKLMQILIVLIQEKILKIKFSKTCEDESVAQIINSISSDLASVEMLEYPFELLSTLPRAILCIGILVYILGPIGLIGVGVSVLHVPFVIVTLKFMMANKLEADKYANFRIGLTKNFIESIQALKVFVWEKYFINKVAEERKKEAGFLRRFDTLKSFLLCFGFGGISLTIFCTFSAIAYKGYTLNLGEILLVVNCLLTLQFFIPLGSVLGLSLIHIIKLTIKKIEEVLLMPEYSNPLKYPDSDNQRLDNQGRISFFNNQSNKTEPESFLEDTSKESHQLLAQERLKTEEESKVEYGLNQVNFEINPGELVMVIGKIGSGKSSLLLYLLNEFDNSKFNINTTENISYYSEDP